MGCKCQACTKSRSKISCSIVKQNKSCGSTKKTSFDRITRAWAALHLGAVVVNAGRAHPYICDDIVAAKSE